MLLAAAIAVKLIALAALHDHPLLRPRGDLDTAYYVQQATRVAGGDWNLGGEPFFVSPLYIFVLGAIFTVAGASLLAAQVVQAIGGAIAVGAVALTARQWYGARAGWMAGALAIGTGVITLNEIVVLQSAIDPLLTSLWLAALTRALLGSTTLDGTSPVDARKTVASDTGERARPPRVASDADARAVAEAPAEAGSREGGFAPARRASARGVAGDSVWWILTGVAFGLHGLNRPNVLLCVGVLGLALVALWRWREGVRRAALVAAGVAIVLAPMALRNYASFGEPLLVSAHGGLNFYIGNSPDADGTYSNVPGITPSIRGQVRDARRVAEAARSEQSDQPDQPGRAGGSDALRPHRPLTEGEISSFFYGRAFAWIAAHPGDAAALFARKLAYTFNAIDLALNYSYTYFARDERSILSVLIVGPWLLVPLGLTGLIVVRPAAGWRTFLPWALMTPAYALGVALFFVSGRYRLPLLLPLTIAAGGLVSVAIDAWRARATDAAHATHAAHVARAAHARGRAEQAASRPDADSASSSSASTSSAPSSSASRAASSPPALARPWPVVVASLVLFALLANWPVALDDGRADARTERIVLHIEAGEDDAAAAALERATPGHPQPGVLHYRAARAWHARGALERAVAEYRRALTFDADQPEILFNLGEALAAREAWSEAVPPLERACAAGVRAARCHALLAHALAASGQPARAIELLRALRRLPTTAGAAGEALGRPDPGATPAGEDAAAPSASAAELALLGSVALDLRQPDLAESWLAASLARDPNRADVQEQHGLALMLLDRPRDAMPAFERAIRLDPTNASAAYNLAVAHLALNESAEARRWVEEALRRNPSYDAAQRLRASIP